MNKWFFHRNHLTIVAISVTLLACQHDPVFPVLDYTEQAVGNTTTDTTTAGVVTTIQCDPEIVYFEKDVLPILLTSCAYSGCHDTRSREDGVILNNYSNTLRTGEVKPYNPGKSELYEVLYEKGDDQMPPPGEPQLSQAEKDVIRDWIGQGAEDFHCDACEPEVFSFSEAISLIMDNYCLRCHNGARKEGDVSLEGYDLVKAAAEDGSLLGTVIHANGYPLMPEGAPLPDCEISQIKNWIDNGAPND